MPLTDVIVAVLLPLSGIHIGLLLLALMKLAKIEGMVPDIHRRLAQLEERRK